MTDGARRRHVAEGPVLSAIVAFFVAFFVVVQLVAVDYGDGHWDEPGNVDNLDYALEHRVPMPRSYIYPGALTLVLGVAALPEIVTDGVDGARAFIAQKPFVLRARTLLILLSALSVIATFSLSRALGARAWEALCAAGLVATSWALGTHARFIANDAMVATCSAGALALGVWALRTGQARALWTAALVGGIATGFKYTPVGLAAAIAFVAWTIAPAGRRAAWVVAAGACFVLGFVITTPGIVTEPRVVWAGLDFSRSVYATGWGGYSVDGPADVVAALVGWLLFAALAKPMALAVVLFLLSVVGAVAFVREPRARPLFVFAALFVLVFLPQRAFIARNLLALIPVLAVCAARALALLSDRAPRAVGPAVAALLLLVSGVSVARAAWTSAPAQSADGHHAIESARAFLDARADEVFVASPGARAAVGAKENLVPPADGRAAHARFVLALPHELFVDHEWPANDPFLVARVFGPEEIDWRYAPSWVGRPRLLLLPLERARDAGAALDFTPVARTPPPPLPVERIER